MTDYEQKKIFQKNLTKYLSVYNKSQKEVADAIGVSPQTFNTWCQGIALPRMGKVQLLADYFKINKSDLIEDHPIDYISTSGDVETLIEITKNYDKNSMQRLLLYAKKLKELQDLEN